MDKRPWQGGNIVDTSGSQGTNVPAGPASNNSTTIRWVLGIGALIFMGLLGLIFLALIGVLSTGLWGLLVGIVFGALPVPFYVALALWLDRYEKEPVWMLAGTFIWGATVAVFFAFIFNTINSVIFSSLFGSGTGDILGGVVSAPIVEESAKGIALFILYWWKKDEFDGVVDGVIYAAMVGLGFAMSENFLYYGRTFAEGGIEGSIFVFVLRGLISPFAHPLFTSMTGIGLGIARQSNNGFVKFIAPVIGLLAAMMLHSLWNFSGVPLGLIGFLGTYLLVMVPALIGVLIMVILGLRREGQVIRYYLTPELQNGLITRQQYDTLGSVGGRIGSSFRALGSGGFGGWRANARFGQAATELAFHRDRVQRGITSVDAARREAAYVQNLRDLRAQV
ncbi:MAG TPA: PrsW family intramembrane metalloprotease [Rubrobacter sp.]|nr:PrsW family intramembrane metalloprotease [Rubrobacter sp.]